MKRVAIAVAAVVGCLLTPFLALAALIASCGRKSLIGLGPHPLISLLYHQKALELRGFPARAFVTHTYFITDQFEINFSKPAWMGKAGRVIAIFQSFFWVIFRCRGLYIFFSGGPFGALPFLNRVEPWLYSLAKVKVVAMPYGSDIQDLTRSPNLLFKHATSIDYPDYRFVNRQVSRQIDRWTRRADAVIGGVEWVDYMYYWSDLSVGYFSIDLGKFDRFLSPGGESAEDAFSGSRPMKVLHAPNHRAIKGTGYLIDAVEELRREGVPVELVLVEKVPNEELLQMMAECDVIADQLVIGWYAMFAIEAMAMKKPVICYIREDLKTFYEEAGVLEPGSLPFVNSRPGTIKDTLRSLVRMGPGELRAIGESGRDYTEKHHSLEAIGRFFEEINVRIGIARR